MTQAMNVLHWQTMTGVVNNIKSPNSFLKTTFFGNEETLGTSSIEIDSQLMDRQIAPFVRVGSEGILVGSHSEAFYTVKAPNIRIKRPFNPEKLIDDRRAGDVVMVGPGQGSDSAILSSAEKYIADTLRNMENFVSNAEEWLCSRAIQGTITYSSADEEVFQITYPKPSANNITLTTFWDDVDTTLPTMEEDFLTAKRVAADSAAGLPITDAIMGTSAASYFRKLIKKQPTLLDTRDVTLARIDLTQQFSSAGVLYMGNYGGVDCWEYSRTATLGGVSQDMIRSKYVEFLHRGQLAERVMYYGCIVDMKAVRSGVIRTRRFAKSWVHEDPSTEVVLLTTRPLPVPRRFDAGVSMKVISG